MNITRAQAIEVAYSSFAAWLRDTELKIQTDNPLILEVANLRSGLAYLKVF